MNWVLQEWTVTLDRDFIAGPLVLPSLDSDLMTSRHMLEKTKNILGEAQRSEWEVGVCADRETPWWV